MKTICFYFQVHQPLRLKKYRFFNMGKDHLYLDDYANRTIMQKVARRCYLPMNELLLKLIRENGKKFKVAFSISGIAIEQFRMYAPEVLDSFQALAARMRRVSGRNVRPLAGLAGQRRGVRRPDSPALPDDRAGVRRQAEGLSQHRTDLFGPYRGDRRLVGLPHDAHRGGEAHSGLEKSELRLRQRDQPEAALAAAQLQAQRRHRVPLLGPQLERVAADSRQIRRLARQPRHAGRDRQSVHGLRDLRRAPVGRDGHFRLHGRPARQGAGDQIAEIRHAERSVEKIPARRSAALALPDLVGRRRARRDGMDRQRASERGVRQAVQAPRQDPRDRPSGFHLCLEFPAGFGSFLLHGHQMVFPTATCTAISIRTTRLTRRSSTI